MKKKFVTILIALMAMLGLGLFSIEKESSLLESNIKALADVDPFMYLCNKYCFDCDDCICVLETIYGVPFNCIDMFPRK